jgi:GT2 family glycosyltransferase
VQRAIYNQVGGLNETNLTIAFNDVDFCLKVREAGYRNIWTPYAELYHHESVSRGAEDSSEKQLRFLGETTYMKNRWFSILERDPYYNINLTKEKEDFSLGLKYTPHLRDPQ